MTESTEQLLNSGIPIDSLPPPSEPAPQLRLKVAAIAKLNLADFQNAVPALRELAVCNESAATISELTLTVTSEPVFLKPRTCIWTK